VAAGIAWRGSEGYATHWETIKTEWELSMSPAEVEAVVEMKATCE